MKKDNVIENDLKFKLPIQFFNEGEEGNEEGNEGNEEGVEDKQPKMYTEEELTKKIFREVGKVKAKMPPKEELQAFKEWQESQKTNEEKLTLKEKELAEKELKIEYELKKANLVSELANKGVPTKAFKLFIDDYDGDNLDELLEEHEYLTAKPVVNTGFEKGNTKKEPKDLMDALRQKYIK